LSLARLQYRLAGDLVTLFLVLILTQAGGSLLELKAAASLSFLPNALLRAMPPSARALFKDS
jgi:hypothetical protein